MVGRDQSMGFDLHIVSYPTYYEEEYSVMTVVVTYPGLQGQEPITVDYSATNVLFDKVLTQAIEDIKACMVDLEDWQMTYLAISSDVRKQLLEAQYRLDAAQENLNRYTSWVAHYERAVASAQHEIQGLQAQLGEEGRP